MEAKTKGICKVCNGKGGWKKEARFWFDEDWQDCLYCEGYGFVEQEGESLSEVSFLLRYNGYKKMITDVMDNFGKIISYTTVDKASTIEISYMPKDRLDFANFAKMLMKFAHFNNALKLEIQQVFFYEPKEDKHHYYWRIVLKPSELSDLDGFVDFIRAWEKSKRRLRNEDKGTI
jgi:hypothetical protein